MKTLNFKLKIILLIILLFVIAPTSAEAGLILKLPSGLGLSTGLVGHWTMDASDISGTSLADRSPVGTNTGTISGATPTEGKLGQALSFDGVDDWVNNNSGSSLDDIQLQGGGGMTISFWMKAGTKASSYVMAKGTGINNSGYWSIVQNGSSNPGRLGFVKEGATDKAWVWNGALTAGVWQHIVLTWDGTMVDAGMDAYKNTSLLTKVVYADGASANSDSEGNLYFGTLNAGGGAYPSDVSLDDVRIYNRILSQNEIKRLYNMSAGTKVGKTDTNTLDNGLIGHWTMDGSTIFGTSLADVSGNGNTGTISGATPTEGKLGQGMSFNSDNGNVQYTTISNPGNVLDGKNLTLSAWIYPRSFANSYPRIFDRVYNGQFALYIEPATSALSWALSTAGGSVDYVNNGPDNTISLNKWQHVVLTWDGTKVRTYVNNVLTDTYGTGLSGGLSNSTSDIRIGQRMEALNRGFNGIIDDARIYNRALTQAEVTKLYNMGAGSKAGVSPSTNSGSSLSTGLVGHWTFDGNKIYGTQAYDSSLSYATGTISGATPTEGKIGQAMSFNGNSDIITLPALSLGDNWSLTLWFNLLDDWNVSGSGDHIIYGAEGSTVDTYLIFRDDSGYNGALGFRTYNPTTNLLSTTSSWKKNHWYFVALTCTSSSLKKIYINGVYENELSAVCTHQSGGNAHVLGDYYTGSYDFDGRVDDVRLYNRVLSASEVQRLYNMGR